MARMSRRIAYVSSWFPVLREAFGIREVLALERAGVNVCVFSLKSRNACNLIAIYENGGLLSRS